jgi:hypothetical protein
MARKLPETDFDIQGIDEESATFRLLQLESIAVDQRLQSRKRLNPATVDEYAEVYRDGGHFPPIVVYQEGEKFWLSEGFHRFAAADKAGVEHLHSEIRIGGFRDALLNSVGANHDHGLPRTIDDKWKSVEILLNDPEWQGWSNNLIAKASKVSSPFVSKVRQALASSENVEQASAPVERKYVRDGQERKMGVGKIGAGKKKASKPRKKTSKKSVEPVDELEQVRLALGQLQAATARKRGAFLRRALAEIDPVVKALRDRC